MEDENDQKLFDAVDGQDTLTPGVNADDGGVTPEILQGVHVG
jgi:hypothetical protein